MALPQTIVDASENIATERQLTGAALYTHDHATPVKAVVSVRGSALTVSSAYTMRFRRGNVYGESFTELSDAAGLLSFDSDPILLANGDAIHLHVLGLPADTATAWTAVIADGLSANGTLLNVNAGGHVSLSATGLDQIPITPPAGVPATFAHMLVMLYRRFFFKSTLTSAELKTYANDGTTVITTQTIADDGTTQTQGSSV